MKLVMESMTYVSSLAQASLLMEAIGALSSYYKGPSPVTDAFLIAGKVAQILDFSFSCIATDYSDHSCMPWASWRSARA
jgi:hypothetical protein